MGTCLDDVSLTVSPSQALKSDYYFCNQFGPRSGPT